jgi:hypothetical protein
MNTAISDDSTLSACPVVTSTVNYLGDMDVRPVFHAQQRERDNLVLESHDVLESHEVEIYDARGLKEEASLESNGFTLVNHVTGVADFTAESALEIYRQEIRELILGLTGADEVIVMNTVLRWSERAGDKSAFVNSHPARFVHVDYASPSKNSRTCNSPTATKLLRVSSGDSSPITSGAS